MYAIGNVLSSLFVHGRRDVQWLYEDAMHVTEDWGIMLKSTCVSTTETKALPSYAGSPFHLALLPFSCPL